MGAIQHVFTSPIADGTNTQLVRPGDWNSIHQYTLVDGVSVSGTNTAGTLTPINSGTLYLAGSNVTLSQDGNSVTISGANTSAQQTAISGINAGGTATATSGTVVFSNSNGVSWGLSGQTVTATVATNYQAPGAYLTTAALSQDSSKYAGTSTGMTGGSVTLNTSGIAINLPAYLTTAMLSNAATISNVRMSAGTLSNNLSALTVADSNGVSWGLNTNSVLTATVKTDYQTSGAYLTTAALSGDTSKYAGVNSGATNCSVTVNTSGVSVNLPAYITTADLSANSSDYFRNWKLTGNSAGTGSSKQGTDLWLAGGQGITLSGSSNTISFSVGSYITTGALSEDSSKYAGINSGATNCSVTANTSGVSVNVPATALGLNTAGTNMTWTANSSGLSINAAGYAGTISGATGCSVTVNSSGVSVNVPGVSVTNAIGLNTAQTNVTWTANSSGLSLNAAGYAGTVSGATNCSVTANTSGVSVKLPYISYLNLVPFFFNTVTSSFIGSTSHMIPFVVPQPLSIGSVRLFEVGSVAGSSTEALVNGSSLSMSGVTSHNFVFYSRGAGASSGSLQYVTSTQVVDQALMSVQNAAGVNSSQVSYTYRFSLGNVSFTKDYSSTAQSYNFHTSGVTDLTGTKMVDYPCGVSLSPGQWFLGYGRSSSVATQNAVISVATRMNISYDSQFVVSQNTLGALGTLGGATSSSVVFGPVGLGSFSTGGAAGTTASLDQSVISSGASNQVPLFQLVRIV